MNLYPRVYSLLYDIPIHKNDGKNKISNYRSISIASVFAKLFEALL